MLPYMALAAVKRLDRMQHFAGSVIICGTLSVLSRVHTSNNVPAILSNATN